MKLCKLRIKNFRGYSDVSFDISNLNVIIGKNDAGKSTILDALEVFFNNVKPDINDVNVYGENKIIEISCAFDVNPDEEIILDSSENTATTLRNEYLVNKDGLFEITKIIDLELRYKESTRLVAKHPTNFITPLILMKITELKKYATDNGIDLSNINQTVKKDIRQTIFQQIDLVFDDEYEIETDAKDSDIMNIFKKFKDSFPLYMLFRADRTNTDKDKEVNDTTKAITKSAVSELEEYFEDIKSRINAKIIEVANNTLEKLKTFDPNIANELTPNTDAQTLDKLFSFTFACDDGIMFNKRGSGVKRLMLLSFFLAEAERNNTSSRTIIYAIEEPETSQHPDFQIMLMESLKQLAESNNRQIILTTHTPEIVKMINRENLIFIQKDLGSHSVISQQGNEIEIAKVRDTLGILPFASYKGVIFVEGQTDIRFLKNLCDRFDDFCNIIDLRQFTFISLNGGGNVESWIYEDYFQNSNIKCFYFMDGDNTDHQESENVIHTAKREIENYIPTTSIETRFPEMPPFTDTERSDWNTLDVANTVYNKGIRLGTTQKSSEGAIKGILQGSDVWDNITFSDEDATEITGWFNKMRAFFE